MVRTRCCSDEVASARQADELAFLWCHPRHRPVALETARLSEFVRPAAQQRLASGKNVELVGANRKALPISGDEASTSVQLDAGMRSKVSASLTEAATTGEPDRVFLNLENVRGLSDATAFHVYVALPKGADPAKYPERLAGSIALFGVRKASLTDEEHAGKGLTFVLVTKIVDALHLDNALDVSALDVRIVPVKPVPKKAKISIGRISIFRQGV
ncbi:hypothetical protein [Mesorhizobium amorphae]|uniref:DUF7868 domain-containing protein n=1 Tax=Mesorhizobium amorphae TaxID=71433 RepID=UPI001AEDBE3E|nr:hypothetical protein [Mesorhizobium amorphae]